MDPKNTKALYFRCLAFLKLTEFEQASETVHTLLKIEPDHVEGKKLLVQVKKERQAYQDKEGRKFAKMFN